MKKVTLLFILSLIIIIGASFAWAIYAQEEEVRPAEEEEAPPPEIQEMVEADEKITHEDLEIPEPKTLPGNILYPVKDIARGIKKLFTLDPVKKSELELQYANEKIVEADKIVEKNQEKMREEKAEKIIEKVGDKVEKVLDSYAKDIERIEKRTEKVKEKLEDNPDFDKFLDKFTDNEIKQQKLLDKIEKEIPAGQIIEKAEEVEAKSLGNLGEVLVRFKEPEEIKDKIVKAVEKQKGSDFKQFKNLEVLKELEEKVPEPAKEAIRHAQENAFKRMENHMIMMPEEEREKFKDYVKHIGGNEVRHMEVIHDFENREMPDFMREVMEEAKERTIVRIEERMRGFRLDEQKEAFLKDFEQGKMADLRIIKELEGNLSPDVIDKVLDIKNRAMDNFKKQFEMAGRAGVREDFFKEIERFHDVKQLEVFKEIEKVIPEDKKEFFEQMKEKAMTEMKADISRARDERERMMKFKKLAGDKPEHIAIIKEFGPPPEIMTEIMKEQAEKLARKVETVEDAQRLEFLKQRIEEEETVKRELESRHPEIFRRIDEREEMFFEKIGPETAIEQIRKAKAEITATESEIAQVDEQTKTMIMMRSPFHVLIKGAKVKVEKAQIVLDEGFYGEAFGQATAALHEANAARRIIKEIELREKVGQQKREEMEKHFQEEFERKFPDEFRKEYPEGAPPTEPEEFKKMYPEKFKEMYPGERPMPPEEFRPLEPFREFPTSPFEPMKEFMEEGMQKDMERERTEEMKRIEEQRPTQKPIMEQERKTPCEMNCPPFYEPVCGSNGKTYPNVCMARCAEVGIQYQGECK